MQTARSAEAGTEKEQALGIATAEKAEEEGRPEIGGVIASPAGSYRQKLDHVGEFLRIDGAGTGRKVLFG